MCKCEKKEFDMKEFTELNSKLGEENPKIREERLRDVEQRLLEIVENRKAYNSASRERIDMLVAKAVKKRRFYEAQRRKTGKQWGSY